MNTNKKGNQVVITGTHVVNAVAVLSALMLAYVGGVYLKTGALMVKPAILLCLCPSIGTGLFNWVKYLKTRGARGRF